MNHLLSTKSLKPATIKRKIKCIKSLVKHGVDISNPDKVVAFINTVTCASGTKAIAIDSYRDYLNMLGFQEIKLPHIKREEKLPFIPLESEIDAMINATRRKMSTFLQLLKETATRPIEAWSLKWINVDIPNRNVTITPAKFSKPRRLKISEYLLNRMLSLHRRSNYIFSPTGDSTRFAEEIEHFARNLLKQRARVAEKLGNPRIKQISLRTFRHWKATMEYAKTKDLLHVKEMLGHVNIQNTLKYVHIANAIIQISGSFTCKVANNVEEASRLVE